MSSRFDCTYSVVYCQWSEPDPAQAHTLTDKMKQLHDRKEKQERKLKIDSIHFIQKKSIE